MGVIQGAKDRAVKWGSSEGDDTRPKRYWTARGLAGTVADVLAIASPVVTAVAFFVKGSFPGAVMALTLAVLALVFLWNSFRLQVRFAQESRRAQAGRVLARCHQHLRDAVVAINRGEVTKFSTCFFQASQTLASAYSMATRHPCRVSVKDVGGENPIQDSRVKTLCRSEDYDEDSREASLPDFVLVKDNTDFLEIVEGASVFFSNDLSNESGYRNSHFEHQMKPHEYPYRSTIVWPIKGPRLEGGGAPRVIGFLCVDSEDDGTFMKRLDVPSGRAVAHAMYAALSLYRAREEAQANE